MKSAGNLLKKITVLSAFGALKQTVMGHYVTD